MVGKLGGVQWRRRDSVGMQVWFPGRLHGHHDPGLACPVKAREYSDSPDHSWCCIAATHFRIFGTSCLNFLAAL